MSCQLDRLYHRVDLRFGWVAAGSITFTAGPNRSTKLDRPGHSDLTLWGHFGSFGLDFWADLATTSSPGPIKTAVLLQKASKSPNHTFRTHKIQNKTTDQQNTTKLSPRPPQETPQSSKVLPKASPGDYFGTILNTFCITWAHDLSRLLLASTFKLKKNPKTLKIIILCQKTCREPTNTVSNNQTCPSCLAR